VGILAIPTPQTNLVNGGPAAGFGLLSKGLAGFGFLFGIAGLFIKQRGRGSAIFGIILSVIAGIASIILSFTTNYFLVLLIAAVIIFGVLSFLIGIVSPGVPGIGLIRTILSMATLASIAGIAYFFVYPSIIGLTDSGGANPFTPNQPAASRQVTVVYEVTGDSTDSTINYYPGPKTTSNTEATGEPLPFRLEFPQKITGPSSVHFYSLSADSGTTGTTLSCTITVDGVVVAHETDDSGSFQLVFCSGDLPSTDK